ncbi:MAG: alkaline phosphatase family protein [Desulfosporosinus sp.]|nr:alkaline phosphatase family protein [Desulfosporosinus sp.]
MNKKYLSAVFLASLLVAPAAHAGSAHDDDSDHQLRHGHIDHILLISVDGLHAIDVENFIGSHPTSALATLASHGIRYTSASTSKPSDSFPGLLSMMTGGSPVSTGVFYDVSYDRLQYAPSDTSCAGTLGNVSTYDETIDLIDAKGNDLNKIDPSKLPNALNADGHCARVYPHDFVKVNTIFEVVKASGGRTAWADKHPAYDLVNGPSGKGVDDLYTPEITNPASGGLDATVSVVCTADNDDKKVDAVINEIRGYDHTGTQKVGTPTIFGMNFQAVSVGQKVAKDNSDGSCKLSDPKGMYGLKGGYVDGSATPSVVLEYGLDKTDAALGEMIQALKQRGIYESTLMIVTAKHGQAPIDPAKTSKPGHLQDLVAALPSSPESASIADAAVSDDDVALVWLKDQSQSKAVADYLRANQVALHIQEVLAGESLKLKFNDPLTENRTPDLIVIPNYGTIFTTSGKKVAEHGGFSDADTNVALLLSSPNFPEKVIKTPVQTTQIAPTILEALDLDPQVLEAVRKEHTTSLSGM